MAILIKADGTIEESVDISTLKKQQELVGGYIEYIFEKDVAFIINEEGMLDHLPYNEEASAMYGHPLVGDIVVCHPTELN